MDDLQHTLRTPLTVILGAAQVLRVILEGRGVLTEEERELLASIEEQARILNTLLTRVIQIRTKYDDM